MKNDLEKLMELCKKSAATSRHLSKEAKTTIEASRQAITSSLHLISRSNRLLEELGRATAHPQPSRSAPEASHKVHSLELFSGRVIRGEVVHLDGRHFQDCHLIQCTLRYDGRPLLLEGTRFEGCRFEFGSEAALTVQLLECLGLLPSEQAAAYMVQPLAPDRTPWLN